MASTIMVGDAGTDVGVARRASVPVIGVTFGYTETPIEELKPDRVISRMRDLPQAVFELLAESRFQPQAIDFARNFNRSRPSRTASHSDFHSSR